MEELLDALHRAHDTSEGRDEYYLRLLKHLPKSSVLLVLNIFNLVTLEQSYCHSYSYW